MPSRSVATRRARTNADHVVAADDAPPHDTTAAHQPPSSPAASSGNARKRTTHARNASSSSGGDDEHVDGSHDDGSDDGHEASQGEQQQHRQQQQQQQQQQQTRSDDGHAVTLGALRRMSDSVVERVLASVDARFDAVSEQLHALEKRFEFVSAELYAALVKQMATTTSSAVSGCVQAIAAGQGTGSGATAVTMTQHMGGATSASASASAPAPAPLAQAVPLDLLVEDGTQSPGVRVARQILSRSAQANGVSLSDAGAHASAAAAAGSSAGRPGQALSHADASVASAPGVAEQVGDAARMSHATAADAAASVVAARAAAEPFGLPTAGSRSVRDSFLEAVRGVKRTLRDAPNTPASRKRITHRQPAENLLNRVARTVLSVALLSLGRESLPQLLDMFLCKGGASRVEPSSYYTRWSEIKRKQPALAAAIVSKCLADVRSIGADVNCDTSFVTEELLEVKLRHKTENHSLLSLLRFCATSAPAVYGGEVASLLEVAQQHLAAADPTTADMVLVD